MILLSLSLFGLILGLWGIILSDVVSFSTARKSGNISSHTEKLFSSDTRRSMKRRIATFHTHTLTSVGRKQLSVCEEMLPLFRAVLKFCSTNRLFM